MTGVEYARGTAPILGSADRCRLRRGDGDDRFVDWREAHRPGVANYRGEPADSRRRLGRSALVAVTPLVMPLTGRTRPLITRGRLTESRLRVTGWRAHHG